MTSETLIYRVNEIPDPSFVPHRFLAGGDVRQAVWRDAQLLLRAVASLPPESATVVLRYVYKPAVNPGNLQSRLSLYVIAAAYDPGIAQTLRLLVERGWLRRFYTFRQVDDAPAPWDEMAAACDVVRQADGLRPLHTPEFNDRIPPLYYRIRSFEANEQNDFVTLDSLLGRLFEPAVIEIAVAPADVCLEQLAHTAYLARLQAINQSWDREETEEYGRTRFGSVGQDQGPVRALSPMRHPDPLADDILRQQQRFHETLFWPHLSFHIRTACVNDALARMLASVLAESMFDDGSYSLFVYDGGDPFFRQALAHPAVPSVVPFPAHDRVFAETGPEKYPKLARLPHLAPVTELLGAFRLPIASSGSPCCIRKNTDPAQGHGDLIVLGHDQDPPLGSPEGAVSEGSGLGLPRGIYVEHLVKHLFISGLTGSRKTSTVKVLMNELNKRHIPFTVLTSVKTDYRTVKTLTDHPDASVRDLAEHLEIYTVGNDGVSPFRNNPLEIRSGVALEEHADNLRGCFRAAAPLPGPLWTLLGEALDRCLASHADGGRTPTMVELKATVEELLAAKGYSRDTASDIRTALEERIGELTRGIVGRAFQCRHSIPTIDHLMVVPSVIEFDRLPREEACKAIYFVIMQLRQYLRTVPNPGSGVRHVIVLEEAHNIVGRNTDTTPSEAVTDPRAYAAEEIERILVEFRSLGVAVIIADQHPTRVAAGVIKSTATQLAFRQVATDDRQEIGGSMLFNDAELAEIGRLQPGEAFFFTEGYHSPRRIRTLPPPDLGAPATVSDEQLHSLISTQPWFVDATLTRLSAELGQLAEVMDHFDANRLRLASQLSKLLGCHPDILEKADLRKRRRRLSRMVRRARLLKRQITGAYDEFVRGPYRMLLGESDAVASGDPSLDQLRTQLRQRFENVLAPDSRQILRMIDDLIARCGQAIEKGGPHA